MKLLWLCNAAPGVVNAHRTGKACGAVNWVDHVLSGLREREITIRILCPGDGSGGQLDGLCSYQTFREGAPYVYLPALEAQFRQELRSFRPDVIHSWGTEYGHTLAMVNAAEQENMLPRMAASIQGLCSVIAGHYTQGLPFGVVHGFTFRDLLRMDNVAQQAKKFQKRGQLEVEALKKLPHVIGRTDWDRACTARINPEAQYHFCNETLRDCFYEDQWQYARCRKHRIFASSCLFPLKGFHYLLEAFGEVLETYPDATLAVTGGSVLRTDPVYRLRQGSYDRYLEKFIRKHHMEDKVEFLGDLGPEEMKGAFLAANVFALPSTVENSPNSLGEAMLLGVPSVASSVGGVMDLMTHREEGFVCSSTAPYMLAHYIQSVFAMEADAEALGQAARAHARRTHDPEENLETLLGIYRDIQV